jgi:prepilin signal peptidase PulO-like enzyme (type II secretory pathway)
MQTFFLVSLFIFGLLFWSFSSVIIYRIKSWEGWIMTWRSHCGTCNKILQAIDLIPLFSWIFNKWRCRQCKAKVSALYPILELSTWTLFALIWYFLIDYNLIFLADFGEITKLFFWLLIWFISIIYIFYDILFLEISERILASWVVVALIWIIIQSYSDIQIFSSLPVGVSSDLLALNISVWLLIFTIIGLYAIILKWLSEIWDILILLILFWLLFIFNCDFTNNFSFTLH